MKKSDAAFCTESTYRCQVQTEILQLDMLVRQCLFDTRATLNLVSKTLLRNLGQQRIKHESSPNLWSTTKQLLYGEKKNLFMYAFEVFKLVYDVPNFQTLQLTCFSLSRWSTGLFAGKFLINIEMVSSTLMLWLSGLHTSRKNRQLLR